MKNRIWTLCLLLLTVVGARAENVISLSSVSGHPGDEVTVEVGLAMADAVTAAEVIIPLDKQLTYVEGSATLNSERADGHELSAAVVDGSLRLYVYSLALNPLKGTEGALATFRLKLKKEPADYTLTPQAMLSDAAGSPLAASTKAGTVTLLSPKLSVVTTKIDYGHIPIRSTYMKTLTLKNVGNEPLEVTGMTFSAVEFSASEEDFVVQPGGNKSLTITYAPTVRGAIEETVSISSNAVNGVQKASLVADPFSVNELHVEGASGISDTEVEIALRVNNMEPLVGMQCSFALPDALKYVESSFATTERTSSHTATASCADGKLTVILYSSANKTFVGDDGVIATFRLKLDGKSGTYRLTPESVVLSNITVENMTSATSAANVTVKSPTLSGGTTLSLGSMAVTTEVTANYSIRNSGQAPLVVDKVTFLSDGFALHTELPLTIEAGKSGTLVVGYTPSVEGDFSTTMNIYTNDPQNRMKAVTVSGTVYEPNRITVSGENQEDGSYDLTFGLENYTDVVAVQMDIKWLAGMTTSLKDIQPTARLSAHSCTVADMGNGVYRVILYSMSNTPINGNSGAIFTLSYSPQDGTDCRDTELQVNNVVLSNPNGTDYASENMLSYRILFTGFTVQFILDGEVLFEKFLRTGTSLSTPEVPEKEGYTFSGWGEVPETMPAQNLTFNGNYILNKYRLVYLVDSIEYKNYELEYGASITAEAEPTKEGYTFSGWSEVPETMPAQDVTVTGSFTANTYKVTYILEGETFQTLDVVYGTAIPTPEVPAKEGYNFSGWGELPATMPAQDLIFSGTYSVNKDLKYDLIYMIDDEEYKRVTLSFMDAITLEAEPEKEGHTFSGWSEVPEVMPLHDVTVTGTFTANSYTLTYILEGETYKTETVTFGTVLTAPEAPTKEGYTFGGWSEVPATMPAQDVTITGNYTINSYTLLYMVDGIEYKKVALEYGASITAEAEPTKEGYTFSGWSEVPETMPAQDVTVTGSFTVNTYTITYMVDGAEYKKVELEFGASVTAEAEPTKEGYTFSGWSEVPATMPADDVIIEGSFTVNTYTITYMVDGAEYKKVELEFGASVTAEAEPTKEGYTFSGWSEVPATMPADDVIIEGSFTVNTYTITYVVDGTEYKKIELEFGASVTAEVEATKEGYTFSGWSEIPETMPANDVTVEGSFTVNTYTITYMVDGSEYKKVELEYGASITAETEPTKEGYTFSGWSEIPETMPANDVTVEGSFTVNTYTITYMVDGSEYKKVELEYGASITAETEPTKEGYTFSGWSEVPATMPADDVIIEGSFTVNTYTITYMVDGTEYKKVELEYGASVTAEVEPTKEGYTFSGWSEVPATMPAQDLTITGLFTANTYKVTYILEGETFQTLDVVYGTAIPTPEVPAKEGYNFSGWGELPATMPAQNLTFSGSYTINKDMKYNLVYMVDGVEYKREVISFGDLISLVAEPTKEGHTFSGWSEVPEVMPLHDVTVTGTFTANSYTLTYILEGETYKTETVTFGTVLTAPEAPTKEGYTFGGWSEVPATMPAQDVTITGNYTINSYTLLYMVDGIEYKKVALEYGASIIAEAEPTKEGYTFSGWSEVSETMPAQDVTVTGSFTVNRYKITYTVDDEEYVTDSIAYGETIVLKEAPTKEGYTFSGWSEVPATMPAQDVTVTGSFTVNTYTITYMVDGAEYKTVELEFGASVTAEAEPTKEGYTFSGWSEVSETMPAQDVTVTGSFTVNRYKITYTVDGEEYATDSIAYGETIVLKEAPTKEGYTFSGWSEVPETMPAYDIEVKGEFANSIRVITSNHYVDVYTLQGVMVKQQVAVEELETELPRGIYIIEGKKVMVRK